jgi:type I restriction enzyme, S subunit
MTFPRYPTYKDSGVAWIGQVPTHWKVGRVKNIISAKITDGPHTTPSFIDVGVPFLSVDGIQEGELVFENCRFVSEEDHREFQRKAKPERDDILLGKAASTGKIARVKINFEFSIWSPLALIKVDRIVFSSAFIEYFLKSPVFQAQIDIYCTSNTQKNISMDDIPRLALAFPPLPEQRTIAAFLDAETARNDTLVAKQEALIATLQEKRRALISHVVTKGLDPAAPMRDSGVPWLGAVPKHWEVTHLKRIARIRYGLGQPPREHDQGVPLIRATNIDAGKITERDLVLVDPTDVPESKDAFLTAGEIIVVRSGVYTGDSSIIPSAYERAVAGYDMVVTVVQAIPQFVAWSFLGTSVAHQFDMAKLRAAQPHLNAEELGETWIVLPTATEQAAIVAFIESETAQIDTLITKSQEMIAVLHEHRTALVAAAVTGQIDVRGYSLREISINPIHDR